jgi:hypothetical protein
MQEQITERDLKNALWSRGELAYKLDTLQRRISATVRQNADSRKVCILSSRQIGKTFWACVFALEYLLKNPKKIARVIAPTFKQCQDLVNDNLSIILADAPEGLLRRSKTEYRYNLFNGSSLRLGALERAYVDGNRGGNASLIIYEECGFVTADDFNYGVDSVMGPQLLRSQGMEIFVSSPSEEPDHPLHTRVLPEADMLGTLFQYTVYDSPSISPEMILEAARRCGGTHTDAFKREYLAQIIRVMSKVVIPGFDPKIHVKDFRLPPQCHIQLTADWGGTRDMTVALVHTYDYLHNRLLIWDERWFPANTPSVNIKKELDTLEFNWFAKHADVAGQVLIDLFELGAEFATPPKSDWLATVQSMSNLFEMDQIWIHPRCKFLIQTCRAGVFNKNRTDFERLPEIGHCDAIAALMYANRVQSRENPNARDRFGNDERIFIYNNKAETETVTLENLAPVNKYPGPARFGKFRNG